MSYAYDALPRTVPDDVPDAPGWLQVGVMAVVTTLTFGVLLLAG